MNTVTPHFRTVMQLLQSRSFAIDDYQREYKWDSKNIAELLSDLQAKFLASYQDGDTSKSSSSYAGYFLGSIIVTKRMTHQGEKEFLIDGQQRVTSLTLLLIYLYRVAMERGLGVAATIRPMIYSDNYGEPKFNLDVSDRLPALRALFDGIDYNPDGKDESVKNIVARYQDIVEVDLSEGLKNGLETFVYWLINKVGLIEIATESDADAYAIFETMNDRGKPLSPVDMLKASLLGPIEDDEQRALANQTWKKTVQDLMYLGAEPDAERDSTFVKAWLRAKYAQTIRDRKAGATDEDWELIGSVFHRWIRDKAALVGVGESARNLHLMTEEFPFFARAYQLILEASTSYTPGLEPVFYNAHNDFTWQPTVLLAPLTLADDDETVKRKIAATATYLDIWIMRRTVNYIRVGYSSVGYAMWRLCRDIRDKPLDVLIDTLKDKLATEDDITFEGSPSRGRHGMTQLGLNQFSRKYIYHLLARLTAYTETHSGRPDLFEKYVDRAAKNSCDIEHIWPDDFDRYKQIFSTQQEFESSRNDVAVLLLLPADVNRSLQGKGYEEKVSHYAKQNLYAASLAEITYRHQPQFLKFVEAQALPFHAYRTFGWHEQVERGQLVLALANRVWSSERLDHYRALRDGCGGLDFAHRPGHGRAEVLGGGEGLADLGWQSPPLADCERGADAAQRDLHGDIVAADVQQHAQRGIVACLVSQVVVDELDVEVELADVLGLESAELELEDHVAVQAAVVEEQIEEELAVAALDRDLGPDEREPGPQLAQEPAQVVGQRLRQVPLPYRVCHEEVEDERVLDDLSHRFPVRLRDR
jgi:uncharacterized protein with ParB-like and HNH nuclease domain